MRFVWLQRVCQCRLVFSRYRLMEALHLLYHSSFEDIRRSCIYADVVTELVSPNLIMHSAAIQTSSGYFCWHKKWKYACRKMPPDLVCSKSQPLSMISPSTALCSTPISFRHFTYRSKSYRLRYFSNLARAMISDLNPLFECMSRGIFARWSARLWIRMVRMAACTSTLPVSGLTFYVSLAVVVILSYTPWPRP